MLCSAMQASAVKLHSDLTRDRHDMGAPDARVELFDCDRDVFSPRGNIFAACKKPCHALPFLASPVPVVPRVKLVNLARNQQLLILSPSARERQEHFCSSRFLFFIFFFFPLPLGPTPIPVFLSAYPPTHPQRRQFGRTHRPPPDSGQSREGKEREPTSRTAQRPWGLWKCRSLSVILD